MSKELVAEVRKDFRKSASNQLKSKGQIPAVVYGKKHEPKAISVYKGDLLKLLRQNGRYAILSLNVGGIDEKVILGDYQVDPLTKEIIHADFLYVDLTSEINTKVPVVIKGEAEGVKVGGILQQVLYELNISANVKEIPEEILIDVTNLEIGDTLKIADIRESYRSIILNHEDDELIISVIPSRLSVGAKEDMNESIPQTV
ncbi:ribosomal protein L25, Ctc-form [Schinkia azotoformans MEV2011]|uniref:Large ribosomal subunit protein bL25 n=2 Tax=Schinkia azotoformans TaxID=1454 RepID=K6CAH4_SCHAZ|nr:50S ribosomal protein L25 [Schinkia azotoformans]EKN68115.1 ribosomal 5S rRNA E-loop binding protein Ctc/L25/TL5 [Schinkia azotoformans LMG 9581]KEF37254.1 ribosomal protein L25, Ctc-form [Schinkia azotoformans MEV2011]MEC1638077.1 50S ribosomal protein L25 [Schinkia azotoformans]MEC1697362.1 50S ribosomal protein L25 [Schinkia azotoformans]MEC1714593.1 50S ribosomal protein L25 [Schinkia azotoformans]